jgi:tetratricopeptide (TPR) repeat protein
MVFDKTKAMRNAERYLAQGKIQSAISEYKQVVAHDPKDFGTMNMLGDLYTKTLDKLQALECYTPVAEHYSKQGFAQKAIAVYNKISKIQPNSIEVYEKLADLYKFKGSVNEARAHYTKVAEYYEKHGRKVDALQIRKQIASLDPNETAIYLDLGVSYLKENQIDEAVAAFSEAGNRFSKKSRHEDAINAFAKALDVSPGDGKILAAFAKSHFALGRASDAAERLAAAHTENPHDREIMQLLVDCHLEAGNTSEAEQAIVKLVEKEPSDYPRLLDLAKVYLKQNDADSAARVLAVSAEHLLLAGDVDDFQVLISDILVLDPEQLEGLRLRARLTAWQRDENSMRESLAQLATVARVRESIDDERFALSQLVMIAPQEVGYADRLREINEQFGYDDSSYGENLFDKQFLKASKEEAASEPKVETFPVDAEDAAATDFEIATSDFAFVASAPDEPEPSFEVSSADETAPPDETVHAPETEDEHLAREIDSIRFYIDNGYTELAFKAISELRGDFGDRPEIDELVAHLEATEAGEAEPSDTTHTEAPMAGSTANGYVAEPVYSNGSDQQVQTTGFGIDDLRSELGLDEPEIAAEDADYDTHFHTAVAYQEMGLLDEAVKEFQEAVALVRANDSTRRFFHCANLLGHCFMQKGMPNLALTWYQRALETPGLSDEEKQGIWYELASAYEAEGDAENAGRYFEQVYAENINFRDVSERVKNIMVGR